MSNRTARLFAAATTAAAALSVAAPAARAGLTFVNTFDTSSGGPLTQNQLNVINNVEAAYASVITANVTVDLNFTNLSTADFTSDYGTTSTGAPAGVAEGFTQLGYYTYSDVLKAYTAHATSPQQVAAAKTLATNVTQYTDGYTSVFTPGNASNPAFATRVNYPGDGTPPRTVRSQFVVMPLANARLLGLTNNLYPSVYGVTYPAYDGDVDLLSDPDLYKPYSYAPLGAPVPAGQSSYAKVIAAQVSVTLGLYSGVSALEDYKSTGQAVNDVANDPTQNNIEDLTSLEDLFRYRYVGGSLTRDLEIGDAPTYLSGDGQTPVARLGTGNLYGDGYAASDLEGLGAGIFDGAASTPGQSYTLTGADAAALDLLGFTANPSAVPEPASLSLVAGGAAGLLGRRRRSASVGR